MANWTGVITNSGISLLSQWVAGSTLTLTAAKAGTGTVSEAAMMAQTGLVTEKAAMSIVSGGTVTGGRKIKLQLTSQTTAFTLNQIGIWAKVDSGTAVLLALYQNTTGVPIPSSTDSPDFCYNFYATLSISNTGTFSITIDPTAFVSESTMEEYAEALDNKVTEISASSTDTQYPSAKAVWNNVYTPLNTDKQSKTDSSLTTTAQTVVGAINEHETDISSLNTNKANKVSSVTAGHLANLTSAGDIADSGYATNNILGLSYSVVSTWT